MGFFSKLFSPKIHCQPPYDFFISYKGQYADIVRPIAEQLMANRLSVWFAEYGILLSVLSSWDDTEIEKAIDRGIRSSTFGICFTNELYFRRRPEARNWCLYELGQLYDRKNAGLLELIEFKLPDEPSLDQHPEKPDDYIFSLSRPYTNVNQVLVDIQQFTGLPIELVDVTVSSPDHPSEFYFNNIKYALDLGGWDVDYQTSSAPDGDGDVRGPSFRRWFGQDLIWGHVIVGRQGKHIRRKKPQREGNCSDDDNFVYYQDAIRFANWFFGNKLKAKCVGVHSLWLHNYSHSAITFSKLMTWTRLYSIIIPDPNGREDIEFAFYFYFRGKFTGFCRYVHYADKVVQSLRSYA